MPEDLIDDAAAARELLGEPETSPQAVTQEPLVEATTDAPEALEAPTAVAEATEQVGGGAPADPQQDELLAMLQQASPEERAQILAEAQQAAIGNQVAQVIAPYRDQLQARVEAGELDTNTANELLEERAQATYERMQRESAQAQAQEVSRKAALDSFFTQVTSEFPGADVETLRLLSGQGIDPNALRTIAARQSQQAKKIEETAVAKYVAEKTKDGEAFVPAPGNPSRPSGTKTLSDDSSYGELLGL